jgi:hypothetical protein
MLKLRGSGTYLDQGCLFPLIHHIPLDRQLAPASCSQLVVDNLLPAVDTGVSGMYPVLPE